jgi:hypothetical protein
MCFLIAAGVWGRTPINHEKAGFLQKPSGQERVTLPQVRGKRSFVQPWLHTYLYRKHFM